MTRIALPFTILDSCPRYPLPHGNELLITVCRVDSGSELNGGWQLAIDLANRTTMPRIQAYASGKEEMAAPAVAGETS